MRLLLGTHAYLWWLAGDAVLPQRARASIADLESMVLVGAASAGRSPRSTGSASCRELLPSCPISRHRSGSRGLSLCPSQCATGSGQAACRVTHRDPFDRMLIAQAILEDCVLVSSENLFDSYGILRRPR